MFHVDGTPQQGHFQAGGTYSPTAAGSSSTSLLSFWNSCSGKLKEIQQLGLNPAAHPIYFYPQTITLKIPFKMCVNTPNLNLSATSKPMKYGQHLIKPFFSKPCFQGWYLHDPSYSPQRIILDTQRLCRFINFSNTWDAVGSYQLTEFSFYYKGLQQSLFQRQTSGNQNGFKVTEMIFISQKMKIHLRMLSWLLDSPLQPHPHTDMSCVRTQEQPTRYPLETKDLLKSLGRLWFKFL